MFEDWRELLKSHYASLSDSEQCVAWNAAKLHFQLGDCVAGEVVSVAPFGAWIDFGIQIPGLLLVTRFHPKRSDYPKIGDMLRCWLVSFNDEKRTLVLTQDLASQTQRTKKSRSE